MADATNAVAQKVRRHLDEQREVLSTFNVAFFGRTGAGNSTLLSAFGQLTDVMSRLATATGRRKFILWHGAAAVFMTLRAVMGSPPLWGLFRPDVVRGPMRHPDDDVGDPQQAQVP